MRDPGNLHPPLGLRRRPRPRIRSYGALEVLSVRVLRPVRTAPRDRGAGATRKALRSPKEPGLIVSPPAWRGARLRPGACLQRFRVRFSSFKRSGFIRSKVVRHPNFPNPNPGKHVNSSILEPNASTISELLVHSAPFSTL